MSPWDTDHPTYYHFHIHIVNVNLEASGHTQSTGKAFGLENLISWLESMGSEDPEKGMHEVNITYFVGEEGDIWKEVFGLLKEKRKGGVEYRWERVS